MKTSGSSRLHLLVGLVALSFLTTVLSRAQEFAAAVPDSSVQDSLEAGESAVEEPKKKLGWNEFDGSFSTLRVGAGFLYEVAAYSQDEPGKQQFFLEPGGKVRDFRLLFKGRFKTKRPVTWTCGIMFDGATDSWLFRETGVMIAVPELWGDFFIGRTKEGFSLNKVMVGYAGWTMERATVSDATIPLLADGIKWLGHVPHRNLLWNIGFYTDWLSEGQSFSSYDWQGIVRVAWLLLPQGDEPLLHIGLNGRYGKANGGALQIRSKPEASAAPYYIDTGKFPADHATGAGLEAYYRMGPWLFGTEYYLQSVSSSATGNPVFYGGDVVATWIITGETRQYNTVGGFFRAVSPARSVFDGGSGAWEAVMRLSYIDLDDGTLHGGKFWRLTPMVNWHLSDNLRLEFTYGYGVLDRFNLKGSTSFFQARLQVQI